MNPKLRRQLRQGFLPRKRRHRHSRLEFRAVLLPLYAHVSRPLDRSALSLSCCPKIRNRRKQQRTWLFMAVSGCFRESLAGSGSQWHGAETTNFTGKLQVAIPVLAINSKGRSVVWPSLSHAPHAAASGG